MAEISDDAPPPPAVAGDGNDAEVSAERPTKPGIKRLVLTLSVLVSFLAGLPFFLKSTEIYRSPLPFEAIDVLSGRLRSHPPSLPCRFQAVFLHRSTANADRALADRFQTLIYEEVRKRAAGALGFGGCSNDFAVSVTIDSGAGCIRAEGIAAPKSCFWKCASLNLGDLSGSDDAVDELLNSALKVGEECSEIGGGRVYTVVVMEREDSERQPRVVVGKHRHAWIAGKVQEPDAALLIGKIFVDLFMDGGKKRGELAKGRGDFMPVGADGSIILSFSLLNADPSDWVYDWEFEEMSKILMAPMIDALAPIAKISIESQVLYHTPKSANSHWDENLSSYVFSITDLPFFVNSNEWHLDTSIAAAGRSKVLQFAVYVPSARECPLLLRLPKGDISKTNGFISPMWGGVVAWNPPNCSRIVQSKHIMRSTIPSQELQEAFQIFIAQIRMLFGLKSNYLEGTGMEQTTYLASERGFTEWELDVLYRYHTCFNLQSCATTLESLSKLVQSLPRMIVMDEIGKQVKYSLEAANLAQENASLGAYDASASSSRQARALAEDAFFHPSIMSISYSSIEHYFAIYMPFFAPVSLHVLLAAIKELKRYKREKAKYMAFTAKHAST